MKKFLGLLLLPLGLCLAACAQEEAMPPVDDNNIVDNEVNDSDNATNDSAADVNDAINQAETASYYGQWLVTENIATAPVYALSQEEIDQMIGAELSYTEESFISPEGITDKPAYQESRESDAAFGEGYNGQLSLNDLGIAADEVTAITIANSDYFGSLFYSKDDNTLIISYNGVFSWLNASRVLN